MATEMSGPDALMGLFNMALAIASIFVTINCGAVDVEPEMVTELNDVMMRIETPPRTRHTISYELGTIERHGHIHLLLEAHWNPELKRKSFAAFIRKVLNLGKRRVGPHCGRALYGFHGGVDQISANL